MEFTSVEWPQWQALRFPPLYDHFCVGGFGSDEEPYSSLWMASLSAAMGSRFAEGMRVLDYGCGAGRYCNFLSGRLKEFTYYGVEPRDAQNIDGVSTLEIAKHWFGKEPRAKFDAIEDIDLADVLTHTDVVLLGSVFTHLLFEHATQIFDTLKSILDHGIIVFSLILRDEPQYCVAGMHNLADCYAVAIHTWPQWDAYFTANRVNTALAGTFPASWTHQIYRAS